MTNPSSDPPTTKQICRTQCEERLADLRAFRSRRHRTEDDDEPKALSIEPRKTIRILLSWGGPSDGFDLTFDVDGTTLMHAIYWYADWFTYAEESLDRDDAEIIADLYLGGDVNAYFPC